MEQYDAHKTLENNLVNTGIKTRWLIWEPRGEDIGIDGQVELLIANEKIHLFAEVKNEVKNYQLEQILQLHKKNPDLIVIAKKIYPKIREALREQEIAYLEENGNFFFKKDPVYIWIDGKKELEFDKARTDRAFTRTGLKVIFEFLLDENLINAPYRDIARKTKAGLGNINYIMNGLKKEGFLLLMNKGNYRLLNKKQLLEKWIAAYPQKLKPVQAIGKFRFLKEKDFNAWKSLVIPPMKTWWGGEPAGDLLTAYLQPARLTLYTVEPREELIRRYRLIPDEDGRIEVYQRFWYTDQVNDNCVPPLLVYADLMNTGEARCLETAKKVYDDYLAKQF